MTAAAEAPVLLDVDQLRVSYGGVHAVNDVTLRIPHGRIVGLIGPNGAGKTSFVDGLTGYAATSGGTITFDGSDITKLKAHRRARAGVVRTFQSVELFDDLTVRENVLIGGQDPSIWRSLARLVVPGSHTDPEAVDWALGVMGLSDVADCMPTELSFGRRKKAGVARAIARRPPVLLLDEPAAGLDSDETEELGQRIRELPGHGVSVLLIDHDMSLVLEICDEVYVLDFGRLIAHGSPEEIRNNPEVINAYLGAEEHE